MHNSILKGTVAALSIIMGIMNMTAKTSYIFLAPGVEEVEATATVDALRRASIYVVTVAGSSSPAATPAHRIWRPTAM